MKRKLSLTLFIASIVDLVFCICFCVYGIIDFQNTFAGLAATPGTSGMDYFGLGWGYGIALFFGALSGLLLSIISVILAQKKGIRYGSFASIALFSLLLVIAVIVFYQ